MIFFYFLLSFLLYNSIRMKSFKNIILSVLLFSFALTIVHDYAFVDTYSNFQQDEVCCMDNEQLHLSKDEVKFQMHNSFHVLLEVSLVQKQELPLIALNEKPFYIQENLSSHVQSVLQRPPSIS